MMARRRDRKPILKAPRTLRADFLNLHDAFLNTSLQRSRMLRSPMEGITNPEEFFRSDRGRFERTYVAFLAALVEAWEAKRAAPVRSFMAAQAPTAGLAATVDDELTLARRSGGLDKLRCIRGYMFHRDEREYWDAGRVAVAELGGVHERLYWAFSRLFLAAFREVPREAWP